MVHFISVIESNRVVYVFDLSRVRVKKSFFFLFNGSFDSSYRVDPSCSWVWLESSSSWKKVRDELESNFKLIQFLSNRAELDPSLTRLISSSSWNNKHLPISGKFVLLKSVLYAWQVYFRSFLKASTCIISKL